MRLLFSAFVCCLTLAAQGSPSAAESEIRELVRQYVDAREHPDAAAIEKLFTQDADQLVSSGEWRKGREDVVKGTVASSLKESGHRTITVESIRFLSPAVAIADGRYELSDTAGNKTRKMWTSLVVIHGAGGWRIAAIRNMLPAK